MKEDILEQLVDDYLQMKGYFTRHNIKFRPSNTHQDYDQLTDSSYSDIDVLGIHPKKRGAERVWAVSCKSWQSGFNAESRLREVLENKFRSGRDSWKWCRELVKPKWSEAFMDAIEELTGQRKFVHVTAVTRLTGNRSAWEEAPAFRKNLGGNPVRLIALSEMVHEIASGLTTTVVPSQLGRTIQLLKASGVFPK